MSRDIATRLDALRQADHWCCEEEFLALCGISMAELEPVIKKWWGNKSLWLDMLATEIGRVVADGLGLDHDAAAMDAWLDSTYKQATVDMSCPPRREILQREARALVDRLLTKAAGVSRVSRMMRMHHAVPNKRPASMKCAKCGCDFSERLGECPICFPRAPPPEKALASASPAKDAQAWESLPSASIDGDLAWDQASRLAYRDGNSGGIFVLQLPCGAVCVKGGACVIGDVFSQRLASALGVRTAAVRVVSSDAWAAEDECRRIRAAIQTAAGEDEQLKLQARMKLVRNGSMAVVEFINGCVMMGMPANRLLRQAEGGVPEGTWQQLGRLMAFDMLLNNFDRLPLAWTNEGNLGNVMLGASQGAVVGIDQSIHPISHPDGLRKYLDRVREATVEARDQESNHFEAVKAAVLINTGVELTASEMQTMRSGCLELLGEVVRLVALQQLEPLLQAVSADCLGAFRGALGAEEIAQRVVTFCQLVSDVASVVQGVLADAPAEAEGP